MINDFSVSRCIILKTVKKILGKRVGKFYNRKEKIVQKYRSMVIFQVINDLVLNCVILKSVKTEASIQRLENSIIVEGNETNVSKD